MRTAQKDDKILLIDLEKYAGCKKCEMICSVFHIGENNLSHSCVKVMKWDNVGSYVPMTGQNCEQPLCIEVCPKKTCHRDAATHKVQIDNDKFIGCKTCIIDCPFSHPSFDEFEKITTKPDFCNAEPQCVAFCETNAIDYIDVKRIGILKKREFTKSSLNKRT